MLTHGTRSDILGCCVLFAKIVGFDGGSWMEMKVKTTLVLLFVHQSAVSRKGMCAADHRGDTPPDPGSYRARTRRVSILVECVMEVDGGVQLGIHAVYCPSPVAGRVAGDSVLLREGHTRPNRYRTLPEGLRMPAKANEGGFSA